MGELETLSSGTIRVPDFARRAKHWKTHPGNKAPDFRGRRWLCFQCIGKYGTNMNKSTLPSHLHSWMEFCCMALHFLHACLFQVGYPLSPCDFHPATCRPLQRCSGGVWLAAVPGHRQSFHVLNLPGEDREV